MTGQEILRIAWWATQRTHINEREDDAQEVALRLLTFQGSVEQKQRYADNVASGLRSHRARRNRRRSEVDLSEVPGAAPADLMASVLYTEDAPTHRPSPSELVLATLPEVFRTRTFALAWGNYHAARDVLTNLARRGRVVRVRHGMYRKAV